MRGRAAALLAAVLLLLSGCGYGGRGAGSLDPVQRKAYENALARIDEIPVRDKVNTSMVQARYLQEKEEPFVVLFDGGDPASYFAERKGELFWVFLIGNASGFEYVQVVCSSRTDEAVGYIVLE